jgi:hypothetical protein
MEYLTIHETVEVAGVYTPGHFRPTAFLWSGRKWNVSEITTVAQERDGGVQLRHYSVVANNQVCRLLFNRYTETWWLEEVWDEPLAAR